MRGKFKYVNTNVSESVKDLILKLICVDVDKRIEISDALKHPWFNDVNLNNIRQ